MSVKSRGVGNAEIEHQWHRARHVQKFLHKFLEHQGIVNLAMKLSASAGLTAAHTKQCAEKLPNTTTKSTATPGAGLLEV